MKLPWFKATLITFLVLLFSFVTSSIVHGQTPAETASSFDKSHENKNYSKQWAIGPKNLEKILDKAVPGSDQGENLETFGARLWDNNFSTLALSFGMADASTSFGAIQMTNKYIAQIITQPPSSSVEYIADLGSKIGLAKPAYAQNGTGYKGLSGVLETWKAFRNISYALFVIIFVVVGFMIMFRSKLNPQTAVTLQLALPKLIITLLLITFSYAIAGFVIDMIYFVTYLVANILQKEATTYMSTGLSGLFNIFNPWGAADTIAKSLSTLVEGTPGEVVADIASAQILGISLMRVIVGGAILFSVLKLLIQLVLAYVNIILQVIFAPIMLLFNALPAGNSFSSWIKNLIANAAAFPAVAIMIMIGDMLIKSETGGDPASLQLPFIGFLSGSQDFVQTIIGFGLIMLLPKVVTMIQEALKAKPAMPAGAAVIEGVGAAAAPLAGAWKARRETTLKREQDEAQARRIGAEVKSSS
jgi:hypothetical protein